MADGVFITLEGGEGVGKTTVINKLKDVARLIDREVVFTREPGGTGRAEGLRNALLNSNVSTDPMCAETEALIINAARSDHVENLIVPALKRGAVIICDRFADSTRAYQGETLNAERLEQIISFATRDLSPDLTLLLDGDPDVLMARRESRGDMSDRFEARDLSFHHAVRTAFLGLADRYPDRIAVIDAEEAEEEVFEAVLSIIANRTNVSFPDRSAAK